MNEFDHLTELALKAQRGDVTAFAGLVRGSQVDVWRICAHLVGPEQADDVTQETFLRVWRALPRYQPSSSVRCWVFTIAHHAAVDALRSRARRPLPTCSVDEQLVDPCADPCGVIAYELAFAQLEPDRRVALILTQLVGLSYAEAAGVCGVPVGTIRSRVARARQDLIEYLGWQARRAPRTTRLVGDVTDRCCGGLSERPAAESASSALAPRVCSLVHQEKKAYAHTAVMMSECRSHITPAPSC